jgi:hypothetical protein
MNVRVWKANASEQLGTLLPREKHKQAYNKSLIERHKHMPEVRMGARVGGWMDFGGGVWGGVVVSMSC